MPWGNVRRKITLTPKEDVMAARIERTVIGAHARAVATSVADIAGYLEEHLGRRLTALMVGIADSREVGRWAKGEYTPRHDSEVALRAGYQVFQLLADVESPHTVRAWFIGMNPQLDDESPVEAIAAGRQRSVLAAARAYASGG